MNISVDNAPDSEISMPSSESSFDDIDKSVKEKKIKICISPEELIECTSTVAARYRVGIRPQTSILAAICNKAGVNLDNIPISRTTVHRKRYEHIKEVEQLREGN